APPGQPDELLNSIDQASVQQLSSEYFSLASPSDVEALYETPSGEKGLTDHSSSEHESTEHAANEHSSEHTSEHSSEHNSGEHISGEHITEEHITAEHTSSDHDHTSESADQSGEQSSEVASAEQVSKVAINCHTCSYMNDEGKCLHGEGVCTTQNSQQCMLKKIFEGGKLQYMVQGCETMCPSMNLFSHGTRTQIICCRNEPLCNKT
ncbi:hypothetical protein A6R68_20859, partial [Neotoma lepida]